MDIPSLLSPEVQDYIFLNTSKNPVDLMLKKDSWKAAIPYKEIVAQIQSRQKALQKLPTWANEKFIVYPKSISIEQSSSEITAQFKTTLLERYLPDRKSIIDLTGGFGVDAHFFTESFKDVFYNEIQPDLAKIVKHNAQRMGIHNLFVSAQPATDFLNQFAQKADCIYLDPARRSEQNQKLSYLEDCEPDVLGLLPLLFEKSNHVLLKASPMLDISQAAKQLGKATQIYAVAVENEVKEILFLLDKSAEGIGCEIFAVNLSRDKSQTIFHFSKEKENLLEINFSEPLQYLYEPNQAILKAGAFKSIGIAYDLLKLQSNTHLYTSEEFKPGFQGRVFKIEQRCRYRKKEILQYLPDKKAHITVRNFPDTVAEIRTNTGIKEGGDIYIFAVRDIHLQPVILICRKLN